MLVLLLMGELVIMVFEGGPAEVLATLVALAAAGYAMGGSRSAWVAVVSLARERRAAGGRLRLSLASGDPARTWVFDRVFIEAVAYAHVIVVPPWFFFLRYGDLFYFGLHLVALGAALITFVNRDLDRSRHLFQVAGIATSQDGLD